MSLGYIFKKFLIWRTLIFSMAVIAMFLLSIRPGFTSLTDNFGENLLLMWANFDGIQFLDMATNNRLPVGETALMSAYFPVYPWLVGVLDSIIHNPVVSGLVISNLAFFLSLIFLYKLLLLDYKEKISRLALFLLLIFPTSFFFGSVYAESVFLLLSVLAFYSARKKNFFLASIFAMIAGATALPGIFLWPAIIIEFYQASGSSIKKMFNSGLIWLSLPPLGLVSYIRYLYMHSGSTVTLFSSQIVKKVILLHQIFYRYFAMIIQVDHTDPLFFTVLLELIVGLCFLGLLIISIKKIKPSYWWYCFLSFMLPTITGTFSGLPRSVVVLFPIFGFLAIILDRIHPYFRYFYYLLSIIFLAIAISLFSRGYFIA